MVDVATVFRRLGAHVMEEVISQIWPAVITAIVVGVIQQMVLRPLSSLPQSVADMRELLNDALDDMEDLYARVANIEQGDTRSPAVRTARRRRPRRAANPKR